MGGCVVVRSFFGSAAMVKVALFRLTMVFLLWVSTENSIAGAPMTGDTSLIPTDLLTNFTMMGGDMLKFTSYISNVTSNIDAYLIDNHEDCINDAKEEREKTFNFDRMNDTLMQCASQPFMPGQSPLEIMWGICKKAELMKYFGNVGSKTLKPNEDGVNCNATQHSVICNPGFFGIIQMTEREQNSDGPVPVREAPYSSLRGQPSTNPAYPCCEGFFCPAGYACMIPCPIGAYCPTGQYNNTTRRCDPYAYTPLGVTCGGADTWGVAGANDQIFCAKGSFCPNATSNVTCPEGNFCRKGSNAPRTCYITHCEEGTANQDLHVIGIAFIISLWVTLIIVYKCSNRALKSREKKKAKARQKAKDQTKERISAMERWKKARNFVMKNSSTFSRQFSRKGMSSRALRDDKESLYAENPLSFYEMSKTGGTRGPAVSRIPETGEKFPPLYKQPVLRTGVDKKWAGDSSSSVHSAAVGGGGDLTSTTAIDASLPKSPYDLNSDVEDLYKPLAPPRAPIPANGPSDMSIIEIGRKGDISAINLSPRSKAYQYAYRQLAKQEMAGKGSLKDVIISAHELITGRVKQQIELKFENLGLALKSSGKKILQNVTGMLRPGRVTAVMGPSGAGKTTFLVAVAGKETYSHMTGHVYINGKEDPIQAYKKIIGFVPQDDIVHGNLTVEENLWFSANYRLPVDMAKCDKVLVVERTILALGLETIRGSRVGTVEKRGISGGQRKRVNVGLEMVMEPSLLILDEPTSGLDSTSSRLVVQALRREAARGVNVGVVLHQPSFGIFCMFDDVMFLAKGGRTVYLGPVDEVEQYFNSLGFPVPDRINPPDHYMDVLEGLVKPVNNPNFDKENLPSLWISHKGITIPDEFPSSVSLSSSVSSKMSDGEPTPFRKAVEAVQMSIEDLWEDTVDGVNGFTDTVKEVFTKVEDKSGRRTPGLFNQYVLVLQRVAKQRFREHNLQVQDYIILLITGAALGFLSSTDDNKMGGGDAYTNTILAVSLLAMIAALRTFGAEMLTFWRESASGIKKLSYFLAKDTVDYFSTIIKPAVYLSMFYFFNNPRSTFVDNYLVTLAMVYCTTGWAYVFSITLPPAASQLCSAVFTLVSTLLTKQRGKDGIIKLFYNLSFARWSTEAYIVANAKRYYGVWLLTRCAILQLGYFNINSFGKCIVMLVVYGIAGRCLAFVLLVMCKRDKQK